MTERFGQFMRGALMSLTPERHGRDFADPTLPARLHATDPDGPADRKHDPAPLHLASPPAPAETGTTKRPGRRRFVIGGILAVAVLALGSWYGGQWWTVGRFQVTTDNAYVGAKNATLATKIAGYVAAVAVEDNAAVRAGSVIATIDDGDYRLAAQQAHAKVATQKAVIARLDSQVTAQQALAEQTRAQLVSARAGAVRAELELSRQESLAARDFASRQALEQAQASRAQSDAGVRGAEAAIAAADANVDVIRGQREEAARTLAEFETAAAKADRDLSFTVIRAPFDGVVGNRGVQVGDYVQPGQRLLSLVPLENVYVDANFKETQLARLQVGQPVMITVDALPGLHVGGTVESVAPASGSVFSLLPPDNATGNFTKIVQRVPVRIALPAEVVANRTLRPGIRWWSASTPRGGPIAPWRL
jgi:membrane fusion protein (multidrug efflux system)